MKFDLNENSFVVKVEDKWKREDLVIDLMILLIEWYKFCRIENYFVEWELSLEFMVFDEVLDELLFGKVWEIGFKEREILLWDCEVVVKVWEVELG